MHYAHFMKNETKQKKKKPTIEFLKNTKKQEIIRFKLKF